MTLLSHLALDVISQIGTHLSYGELCNLFMTGERQMRCSVVQAAQTLHFRGDAFSKFPYTAFSMRQLRDFTVSCTTNDFYGPFTFSSECFSRWGPCKTLEKLSIRFWQSFEVLHPAAQLSWCCPNLKHLELIGSTITLRESMLWDLPGALEVLILKNLVCYRVAYLLDASSVLPLLPKDLYHLELPTLDTTLVEFENEAPNIPPTLGLSSAPTTSGPSAYALNPSSTSSNDTITPKYDPSPVPRSAETNDKNLSSTSLPPTSTSSANMTSTPPNTSPRSSISSSGTKDLPKNLRILRLENLNESRILAYLPSKLEECYFSLSALTTTAAPSELSGSVLPKTLRIFAEEPLVGLVVLDVDNEPLPPEMELLAVQVNLHPSVKRLHDVFPPTLRRLPSNIALPPYNHHEELEFGDLYLDYSKFPNLKSIDASKFEKKLAASLLNKIWTCCPSLTALNLGPNRLDRLKALLGNDASADTPTYMEVDYDHNQGRGAGYGHNGSLNSSHGNNHNNHHGNNHNGGNNAQLNGSWLSRLCLDHLPSCLKNLSLTIGDIDTFREIPAQLEKLVIIGGGGSELGNFLHGCSWSSFLPAKLTSLKIPQEFVLDAATINAILDRCPLLKSLHTGMRQSVLKDSKLFSLPKQEIHPLEKLSIWSIGVELDEFSWFDNLKHFANSLADLALDVQGSQTLQLANHLELLPKTLQRLTLNIRATFEVDALSRLPASLFGLKLSISSPPDKSMITLSNEHFANLPAKLYFLKVDVRGVSRLTKHVVCLLPPDIHYMNITTHDREQRALLLAIRRYYECNPKKWASFVPPHLTPGLHPLRCYFPAEY